jgi:hypothetical protein
MPGVVLTTSVVTGPTTITVAPTSTLFIAGVTERGPEGSAFLVQSLADYEEIYGGYVAEGYVHQSLQTFFEEGGSRAYVSRVIDQSNALSASVALLDSNTDDAFILVASGEGTWAHNGALEAVVSQPTAGETFRIRVLLNDDIVYSTPVCSTIGDAIEEINNSSIAALYVQAVAGDPGAEIPAEGTYNFAGGSNGSTLVDSDFTVALNAFIKTLGPGAVCMPGKFGNTVWTALMTHAAANNRVALLGFDRDETPSEVIASAGTLADATGAEHSGWFYPWVKIERNGLTVSVPCEGYVAAKRAETHNELGSWQAYAGIRTTGEFVKGTYRSLTSSEADDLNDQNVNPIRVINGDVRIYGARSASEDVENYRFLTAKEVVNDVVSKAEERLERLVFNVIDGRGTLFGEVQATLTGILAPIAQAGGLYPMYAENGRLIDPGYKVTVNEALNPVTQLATGTVKARVGMRVSSIGDTIEVEISKSNLTASLA